LLMLIVNAVNFGGFFYAAPGRKNATRGTKRMAAGVILNVMKRTAASLGASIEIRSLGERVRAHLRASNERGQSVVELALCLPILLLIMMGIFTFGIAINNYMMLNYAVSVGGRLLAVSRGQTTNPCADTAAAVYGAAPILVPANLSFTIVLNGNTYTGTSCQSASTTTGAAGNLAMGTTAQVTATYPCNLTVLGVNYAPGCTLTARISEMVQ